MPSNSTLSWSRQYVGGQRSVVPLPSSPMTQTIDHCRKQCRGAKAVTKTTRRRPTRGQLISTVSTRGPPHQQQWRVARRGISATFLVSNTLHSLTSTHSHPLTHVHSLMSTTGVKQSSVFRSPGVMLPSSGVLSLHQHPPFDVRRFVYVSPEFMYLFWGQKINILFLFLFLETVNASC